VTIRWSAGSCPTCGLTEGSRLVDHGHGGGFLLLGRTPDDAFARLAEAWAGRVSSVTDDNATPTGVLVRPDGVVAWASDTTDTAVTGLEAALHRWVGTPTASSEHEPVG
jgi:hypothetical protein